MNNKFLELYKGNKALSISDKIELVTLFGDDLVFDDIFTNSSISPYDLASILENFGNFWVTIDSEPSNRMQNHAVLVCDISYDIKENCIVKYYDTIDGNVKEINFTDFLIRVKEGNNSSDSLKTAVIRLQSNSMESGKKSGIPSSLTPFPIVNFNLNQTQIVTFTQKIDNKTLSEKVEIHYFPSHNEDSENILILGGVHQTEKKAIKLSNLLLDKFTQSVFTNIEFNIIFIPDLFGKRYARLKSNPPNNNERECFDSKRPTNRNFPNKSVSLNNSIKKNVALDSKNRYIRPENIILVSAIEYFKPVRILNIHGHSIEPTDDDAIRDGAPSITVDALNDNTSAHIRALKMVDEMKNKGFDLQLNKVLRIKNMMVTKYPNTTALNDGISFGQWGSSAGGGDSDVFLIETIGNKDDFDTNQTTKDELNGFIDVVKSHFLTL
ncbi:MAG TPA: hypothetical protein VK169_14520 [Saprospiraceae bacterium]|nr:hypothetical protein [Saprospiraceae bacterium]